MSTWRLKVRRYYLFGGGGEGGGGNRDGGGGEGGRGGVQPSIKPKMRIKFIPLSDATSSRVVLVTL
jgi:hypothetical protein